MAQFERLSREAFSKSQGRPRNSYLEEYRGFLADLQPGEGGEITLDPNEKKATIKNRLNHAARVENKRIRYLRTPSDRVRFQVVES
ncbi:MAG: hypothetical protein KatS3mg060_3687 [Dehalococcoidia bacterium]|nr:MAG: hypothetical protein KatS3mg060_3687 [Dehalococcoidia bacterium]